MIIQLYSTEGCHLCEMALNEIDLLSPKIHFTVEIIEIGDNEQLVADYGTRIPVLRFKDGSELNWPFTHNDIVHKWKVLSNS